MTASNPSSYTYQWKSDGVDATGPGATTATYSPVAADLGRDLTCVVTATNTGGSTSVTTATTGAVTAGTVVPNGGPSGVTWALAFSDEFNGDTLDATKWATGWFSDGAATSGPVNTSGYETAGYAAANLSIAGGDATFTVGPNAAGTSFGGTVYPNVGAQITSDVNQGANPGYLTPPHTYFMETSAQMPPAVPGATAVPQAAFWSDPVTWPTGFEIDIVEAYGADYGDWHVHYPSSAGSYTQHSPAPGGQTTVNGATTSYHTYAVLVEGPSTALSNGRATFYYDGRVAGQVAPALPFPDDGRYIILGNSAGGSGALPADVRAVFQYVRVWTYTGTPIFG